MKINVKVTPRANKNEVCGEDVDLFGNKVLKVKTTALPEDGKANCSVVEILAEYFNVAKSKVKIVSGFTSRTKVIEIG
jgi:uncharacterized protein (TIGR00251 family)